MIGLLLVSHSASLAAATESLVRQTTGAALRLELAAGCGPDGRELGTDASAILCRLDALRDCEAIVVLMDVGSAVLSTEMARDLADDGLRAKIYLSPAPFVEGALAAGVAAAAGLPVELVLAEAASGLAQKQSGLGGPAEIETQIVERTNIVARSAIIADPHGLHLRPAAEFVNLASRFDAEVQLRSGARTARADSLTALMAVGAAGGAVVTVEASGRDAEAAAAALSRLLSQPAREDIQPAVPPASSGPAPLSPGTAAGRLFVAKRSRALIPEGPAPDRNAARRRLDDAIAAAQAALAGTAILRAQAALLADPAILAPARERIARDGANEAAAWMQTIETAAGAYARLEDPYLRERARDVREVGDAVLRALLGGRQASIVWPEDQVIALVEELTAAEAASLPLNVLGVLDTAGGASSHAAILLRAAGVPALGNVALDRIPETIAFDGATGIITPDPDPALLASMGGGQAIAAGPGAITLPDGTSLEFWANVSGPRDAAAAARAGAYGIGLARTEILFLDRKDMPGEDEQAAQIAAMLAPFKSRPVVVRVLDAGADKPVPFLQLAPEINPALGVRGIRALLRHRDFFVSHLSAILRAGAGHDLRIMVPMVSAPEEMRAAREVLTAICAAQAVQMPPLGAMIEVPAAAIRVQDLVEVSDFFSIGTNDLTQYVFAAERGNPNLDGCGDSGHAAILDLCAGVVARAGGRPVSVCGEMAGDARTARLLVRSGIRRLSMGAARLDGIRAMAADKITV